jgi:secreted PhoX family phosphatase
VAGLAVAALAGVGPAAAAAQPGIAGPGVRGAGPVGVISTVAGGVGGPARATRMGVSPCGVSFAGGNVYIGTGAAVEKVNPGSDRLTTPVGTGTAGPVDAGDRATKASLDGGCTASFDRSGNMVIADSDNNRIRVVAASTGSFYGQAMTAGHIYTVADNAGRQGFGGNGGPATKARFALPSSVTVDAAGNLVITDTYNDQVRVVAASTGTFYGKAMTAADIYTVAGGYRTGFAGDGGPATKATLDVPSSVTVDAAGNLVITDAGNQRVRVVAASTGTFYGQAMTAADIYTVAGNGTGGFSGDGGPATSAELASPGGVAVDGAGNLLIADTGNQRVRVVAASTGTFYGQAMTAGHIYTVAGNGNSGFTGDGGPATSAGLYDPYEAAVDGAGNLIIADTDNHRVRVVADSTGTFYGQAMTAGHIYTVAGNGTSEFSGNGVLATTAEIAGPGSVAVDGAGNLVIADTFNQRVRTVADSTGTFYGQAMTAGHIYTVAGNGKRGFSGNGGPATGTKLCDPDGVAVDGAGNLIITDTDNNRLRVVADSTGTFYGQAMTAGHIYTVAGNGSAGLSGNGGPATSARLNNPDGVAVDGAGNLIITDTDNNRLRVVAASTGTFYGQAMTAGHIYSVAGMGKGGFSGDGGPATSARLFHPYAVAVDSAGNLIITDTDNERVRMVAASTGTFYGQLMTTGDIYTLAGDGNFGFSGDGGPATSAVFNEPEGVTIDGAGNLIIADTYNDRVRMVAASTGSFYGQAMTAGDIYTVAGTGFGEFSGDGGPATKARLHFPEGVAVDGAGNLIIADSLNGRIREVTG